MIQLVEVNQNNLEPYQSFARKFDSDLSGFQSRIYPSKDSDIVNWYYIKVSQKYIGSIWLEKQVNMPFAVLGIFIADEEFRNKGIGKQAVKAIISADAPKMQIEEIRLNVRKNNIRAIKCYTDCGFIETGRYESQKGFRAISMSYRL